MLPQKRNFFWLYKQMYGYTVGIYNNKNELSLKAWSNPKPFFKLHFYTKKTTSHLVLGES